MPSPFRELTDDDIKRMAREAEALNARLEPHRRKPKGWHYRRAAILLGRVHIADMDAEEVAWHLREALARADG